MRILIDGCDGTGKTSVCEKLANNLGCNIIRLTYGGDRSLDAYFQLMTVENVVHDRTFISEIIYPKYFERKSRLAPNCEEHLFSLIDQLNIKPFILTASSEVIEERVRRRGDEFINNYDVFKRINEDYLEYARSHSIKIIDTTDKTIEEVVREIGGNLV